MSLGKSRNLPIKTLKENSAMPPELIELFAFKADCPHCEMGVVFINRNMKTLRLEPDNAFCCFCARRYFIDLKGRSVEDYEMEQWDQKEQNRF